MALSILPQVPCFQADTGSPAVGTGPARYNEGRASAPGDIRPMINVTEAAASKITELLTEENKMGAGLRVFVQGGGCSGFQYGLMIDEGEGDAAVDKVFEVQGVK